MARHGARVSEAIDLEWDQVDFTRAHLHVRRLKNGVASLHPIQGDELRSLRELGVTPPACSCLRLKGMGR
jgi:type 1 fimbriae regulatory protein FimB/type 1 fimbriae regulatory protein FimE